MTTSTLTVEISGGPVPVTVIRSSRRRRTIAVGVDANGVRMLAPMASKDSELAALLSRRALWIAGRLHAARHATMAAAVEDGSPIPFRGERLTLRIRTWSNGRVKVTRCEDELRVRLPVVTSQASSSSAIQKAVETWYRVEANELLLSLVGHWAAISALTPTRVLVRDQRRRWGSCGPDGTIRLNWRLILLAPRLADYVVVHELVPLRHRNHQAAFWEEVARYIPDHWQRRRELNGSTALGEFYG